MSAEHLSERPLAEFARTEIDHRGEQEERAAIRTDGAPRTPVVVSAADFLDEQEAELPSLWGDAFLVAGGGYLIVSGEGGVGKTIFLAGLFVSLAAGRPDYLGFKLPGKPVPVLILEAEGSRSKFRARMPEIAKSYGCDLRRIPVYFHAPAAILAVGSLEAMVQASGARAALLDPIGRFHDGDENSSTEWRKHVTKPLAEISARQQLAVAISDHYTKPNEARQNRHKLRGSAAKFDDCGAAMRLEYGEAGKSSRVLFFDRVRDGGIPDPDRMALSIDLALGFVTSDQDGRAVARSDNPTDQREERRRLERSMQDQKTLEAAMKAIASDPSWNPDRGASERALAKEAGLGRTGQPFRTAVDALVAQGAWQEALGGWRPKDSHG